MNNFRYAIQFSFAALIGGSLLSASAANAEAAKKNMKALVEVPGNAARAPIRPSCEVRATSGNSAVDCSIDINLFGSGEGPSITGEATFITLDVAIPQQKGSEVTTVGSLDGLAKSYTLGASASRIIALDTSTALLGVAAKGGPQRYTWYAPTSLTKSSESHSSHSMSAYSGITFGKDSANAAYLRFSRESVYKDAKTRTLCPAPTTSAPVECVSGPIGAPAKSLASVVTLQYSRAFSEVGTGMSVSVSRNTTDRITGVEMPIYLASIGTKKSPLSLGIVAGWSNDPNSSRRGSVAVVFSTTTFNLISQE